MEYIIPVCAGIALSVSAGFRAFVPPLIMGLVLRFFPDYIVIDERFAFFTQTPVLVALGVATFAEILSDKIPFFDSFMNFIEYPIKLVVTAVMVFAITPENSPWLYTLFSLILAEGSVTIVHAGKSGLRATSTFVSAGFVNPLISLAEDFLAVIIGLAAIVVPLLSLLAILLIIYKCVRFIFGKKGGNEGFVAKTEPSLFWFRISQIIAYCFFKIYNRFEILGHKNIPDSQVVLIANHGSILDGFILGSASFLRFYIMVKREAFDIPIQGWYLRKVHCFPVDRFKTDAFAIKKAMKILNQGKNLGIYPEGTRNFEGFVGEFKSGAIRLAVKKKLPIVPAYIANSHLITPPGAIIPRPAKLIVSFLKPVDTKKELEEGKTEQEMLDNIYNMICEEGRRLTNREVRAPENEAA